MNAGGKSDESVVPKKPLNKDPGTPESAEAVEGRDSPKGNSGRRTNLRAQDRERLQQAKDRVRQVAQGDKDAKFTTLWHHVYDPDRLRKAYFELEKKAGPGVDGQTWSAYGVHLEEHLQDLSSRLKRGAYRAKPVRRVQIPKADGRPRLIGIPALEDKIVQRATVEVLNAVYETDFLGFSYGFREKRSPHQALDALSMGIMRRKVNWVLDADIRGFFDAIDHECLLQFLGHRIADQRVHRHVKKWLNAGVLEDGEWRRVERGTPQGGSISPLLANVYLHYVFDLWVHQWRMRNAGGDMIVVRFADDFVVGFEHRADAERFLEDLQQRLQRFRLELHPDKTRLLEFGRFAATNRKDRGEGKPDTFDFLGFTHICGTTRRGKYVVQRKTKSQRQKAKLKDLRAELRRRLHHPVPEVGRWLGAVLRGHYQYYAVPLNYRRLQRFYREILRMWYRSLRRRSQRTTTTWARMDRLANRFLPRPRILHPWPWQTLTVKT